MTRSANEVAGLAAKAARGAGAPPGQAADFGKAAVQHLASGRDPEDLQAALTALPKGPILTIPNQIRALREGHDAPLIKAQLSDTPPLFLSYLETAPHHIQWDVRGNKTWIEMDVNTPRHLPRTSRITLPITLLATFETLAARLLVPDTAASRLSGAGAGLTDND